MDAIINKTQQHIPQLVFDIFGAVFFLLLMWGSSYLFLMME